MIRFCQGLIYLLLFVCIFQLAAADQNPEFTEKYWIFFTDKPTDSSIEIGQRSLDRRTRMKIDTSPTFYDIPVNPDYINQIINLNIRILRVSKWLNAVSVRVSPNELNNIRNLQFVNNILPVSSYSRPRELEKEYLEPPMSSKVTAEDYGLSASQVEMIGIDQLHDLEVFGNGLFIGIMDTGFDTSHVAFERMISEGRLIDTYDFLNNQPDVMGENNNQRNHGTQVLSVIGGYDPGNIIGTAYGADYAIAKTDSLYMETMAEEDNWVAAAEWMEGLGVDIISSALGYIDWYDTTQLDGQTAVITQAANAAVELGVIVVNSAGNERLYPWGKIVPPADGDSVIAVGGVSPSGEINSFSSRGPTADGRIKPDFCAQGSSVRVANMGGGYGYTQGTSYSAPLIAGGIALLLEADNSLSLSDILTRLKESANYYSAPNNDYGWGIPNFYDALSYLPGGYVGTINSIKIAPQPAVDEVNILIDSNYRSIGALSIYNTAGDEIWSQDILVDSVSTNRLVWRGYNQRSEKVVSGIYIAAFDIDGKIITEKFVYIRED